MGKRILNGIMNDADGSSLGRGHPAEDRHRLEDGMPRQAKVLISERCTTSLVRDVILNEKRYGDAGVDEEERAHLAGSTFVEKVANHVVGDRASHCRNDAQIPLVHERVVSDGLDDDARALDVDVHGAGRHADGISEALGYDDSPHGIYRRTHGMTLPLVW